LPGKTGEFAVRLMTFGASVFGVVGGADVVVGATGVSVVVLLQAKLKSIEVIIKIKQVQLNNIVLSTLFICILLARI
jgi:hypothetical protein